LEGIRYLDLGVAERQEVGRTRGGCAFSSCAGIIEWPLAA
jgi:hypothetical protein